MEPSCPNPAELIKLINAHPLPAKQERLFHISPLSSRTTIHLLVLERLGFVVEPLIRDAKVKGTHAPLGHFGGYMNTVSVKALRIKGSNGHCLVDENGNDDEDKMLFAAVIQSKSIVGDARFDGPWSLVYSIAQPGQMERLARDPEIDHLVALCQAHILQEQTPSSTASTPRRGL